MTSSGRPSHGPVSRFAEGHVIAGKYRVERVLGAGGMGMVLSAFHLQLRQRVAIKLLLPESGSAPDTLARFAREAQAAARIQSEHVARVIDVASLEDGSPYMVMEFLEGRDLAQILAARGPLPLEEAVGYVLEACEGVAEAHAVGIVHRDLKPSNLFVCERGGGRTLVKVLDFGISKAQPFSATGADHALTRTGAVMGSPLYMSPEQMASSKHVDARTDVWSLGVTLFELLCGATPFRGESMTELIAAVLQGDPIPVSELRTELPSAVTLVVARALAKDRGARYANVAELAAALAPFGPRHAGMAVDRITRALAAGAAPSMSAVDRTVDLARGGAPTSERLGHEATAQAVSVPGARATGSTTSQPVSSERLDADAASSAPARRWPLFAIGGAVAAAAVASVVVAKTHGRAQAVALPAEPSAVAAPAASTLVAAAASAPAAPATQPPAALAPSSVAAASVPTGAPLGAAERPHKAMAAPHPAVTVVSTPSSKAAQGSAATPTCHVVQYLDADGETRFRRECQ